MTRPTFTPLSLVGQTVLITGASAGFGEALAWRFAEAGCKLVLLARRMERLEALKAELVTDFPEIAVHLVCQDLMDIPAVQQVHIRLPSEFSQVDILVNNAGLALGLAAAQDISMEDAITVMTTNVLAVMALTKSCVKGMIERNRGHVINLSSIAGHQAYNGGSMYCASKSALRAYTDSLRHDLVATNIRVTAISPGACKTEFSLVRFGGDVAKADAVYKGFLPLLAADIADNVMYAVTRPLHVQIADIVVLATNQSGAQSVARPLLAKE